MWRRANSNILESPREKLHQTSLFQLQVDVYIESQYIINNFYEKLKSKLLEHPVTLI